MKKSSPRKATVADCSGCREDFYNGEGAKVCWMLKDARVVRRFRTHRDAMPATPGAFTEVMAPSCYSDSSTPRQFYYSESVPDFAVGVRCLK